LKDILAQDFQNTVQELLIRNRSLLDTLTKFQDSGSRVNRALIKAATHCGCIRIEASKQEYPIDKDADSIHDTLDSHVRGELCTHCRNIIEQELGENTKRDRNPDRYPATRMGVQDVVRQAFLDAAEYQKAWDAWEAGGRVGIEPRRDLKLESLAQILRGDRWVHSHSYRADEILQLIRLADEFGFTVRTFQHVLEGYKVADEMAAHGAGASTFSDWWAYKVEAYDAIPYNAALMEERGVLVSINSDSGEEIRHLNQEAAKAMKWGDMAEENALRLVTLNPAKQLGIDDRTGSIEVGKDADLAVWDGPPLSMFAKAVQTYVEGRLYFDIDMDKERQEAIAAEKAALTERHGRQQGGDRVTPDRVAPGGHEEGVR